MQLDVYPFGIKQQPGVRTEEPVTFEVLADVSPQLLFPMRLALHLKVREGLQRLFPDRAVAVKRYLFPPLARNGQGSEDRPLSSSEWCEHCAPTLLRTMNVLSRQATSAMTSGCLGSWVLSSPTCDACV